MDMYGVALRNQTQRVGVW